MAGTRTKICGVMSPEDAAMCLELGADYIGIIFAESPCRVGIDRAREIRADVPAGSLVGVFGEENLDFALEAALCTGLDLIQVHGAGSAQYVEALGKRTGLPVIKAVTANAASTPGLMASYEAADFFLFDLEKEGSDEGRRAVGGSGASGWNAGGGGATVYGQAGHRERRSSENEDTDRLWTEAARFVGQGYRIFLAGRLTPSNVGEAVRRTRPFCVDVSRGVEKSPGKKSSEAVERFIAEARRWS